MIRRLKYISLAALGALALSGTPARAQEQPPDAQQGQQPTQPIPAIRSPLASAADNGDEIQTPESQQVVPDTRPLTGAENLSFGTTPLNHSYWQPRVSASGAADSNPGLSSAGGDWTAFTTVLAGVDVRRTSGISDLLLSYTGGGSFGNGGGTQSGGIQELSFRDSLSFRRLKLSVFEQLSYLPESSFGFAGTAGSGMPVGGGLNLGTGLTPGQSILSPPGQNLSSSTAVESDIRLTPRSSLTFVGAYALLRNFDTDLANFGDTNFQAGYNYQLTRKDTIAVSYQFSAYRYSNLGQSINADTIQGSYGRRVNGRLAFQIGAGPQFVSSTNPILGATSAPSSTTGSATTLSWSLNSSLQYRFRRAALAASYSHGLNGGSGLLSGAEANIVTGSLGEQVSRTFSAALSMGFSRNSGYAAAAANPSTAQKYSYWFTGVTVTHPVNRSLDVFMNYQLQYQDNSTNGCVVSGCSTNLIRNQIAFGMNMHRQPIPF